MLSSPNTRRWARHEADLPVHVAAVCTLARTAIPGRGTEISEGGMALYVGIESRPRDLIEIEFHSPLNARVTGVIRNRSGYCYGLEFLNPLVMEKGSEPLPAWPKPDTEDASDVLTPAAMKMFEAIRSTHGDAAAYALLARVLELDSRPAESRKAIIRALASFVRTRNESFRQRRSNMERLRKDLALVRQVSSMLLSAQQEGRIDPRLPEIICGLPHLLQGECP
jgi:hypothetical protein